MSLQPSETQAQEAVTLQELEGSEIHYQAVMSQYVEKGGKQYAIQTTFNDKLAIGAGGALQHTSTATSVKDGRVKTGKTNVSPIQTIEKTGVTDMGRGPGHVVWVFDAGTLTMLRTYKSGAHKKVFTFTRTAEGIACRYDHIWAFEGDRKSIEVTSAIDGHPLVIVSYKQLSSRCRVTKKAG
jgi:hypothetical protein